MSRIQLRVASQTDSMHGNPFLCRYEESSLYSLFLLFFQVGSLIPSSANIGFFLDKKVMKILKPMKWNFYIIHSCDKFITAFENCFTEFYCSHRVVVGNEKYSLTILSLFLFFVKKTYNNFLCGFSSFCQ